MKIAVIYHSADYDGILSREVCDHFLTAQGHSVDTYGWDYGNPDLVPYPTYESGEPTWYLYDQIYIVDLSYPPLMDDPVFHSKIVWLDHHKSAIEKYEGRFQGVRKDGVAACRICWAWFAQMEQGHAMTKADFDDPKWSESEPLLIYLAGIYDVWDKNNSRFETAKTLQFGLRALTQDEFWVLVKNQFSKSKLGGGYLDEEIEKGWAIRSYCQAQNDEYANKYSHTIKWRGLTWCALNIGQRGNSDLLLAGIKPEHDACFAWRFDGKAVLVSLYHIAGKEHHDLSVHAVEMGGGGHRGACGFRISLAELQNVFCS